MNTEHPINKNGVDCIALLNLALLTTGHVVKKSKRFKQSVIISVPGSFGCMLVTRSTDLDSTSPKDEWTINVFPLAEPKALSNCDMVPDAVWMTSERWTAASWGGLIRCLLEQISSNYRINPYKQIF